MMSSRSGECIAVHPWPECRPLLASGEIAAGNPLVIRIATTNTTLREAARKQIRLALREGLGLLFRVPASRVDLHARPGKPMRASVNGRTVHLSVSHDAGMSVAAISLPAPVGVDIMRVPAAFAWEEVARDYLGPDETQGILAHPPAQRIAAFSTAWTRLEACLKCTGKGLAEWSATASDALRACAVAPLDLGEGWAGSVATCHADKQATYKQL